eukprot:s339_g5.t1
MRHRRLRRHRPKEGGTSHRPSMPRPSSRRLGCPTSSYLRLSAHDVLGAALRRERGERQRLSTEVQASRRRRAAGAPSSPSRQQSPVLKRGEGWTLLRADGKAQSALQQVGIPSFAPFCGLAFVKTFLSPLRYHAGAGYGY